MQGKQVIATQMKSTLYGDIKKLQKRLKQQSGSLDGDLIHDVRVVCKRVRAELVLLKSKNLKIQLKKTSKEIAKELSVIRDAEVMLETFDDLFPEEGLIRPLQEMRAGLVKVLGLQRINQDRVLCAVERLRNQVKKSAFHKRRNAYYKKCVLRAEKYCRKRLQGLDVRQPETFHEYRKAVKAYLFLLKLERSENKGKLEIVKQLAEELGLLHDLHVFAVEVNVNYLEQKRYIEEVLRSREQVLINNIHQIAFAVFGMQVFQSDKTG